MLQMDINISIAGSSVGITYQRCSLGKSARRPTLLPVYIFHRHYQRLGGFRRSRHLTYDLPGTVRSVVILAVVSRMKLPHGMSV